MNNKTKVVAGISTVTVISLLFHKTHLLYNVGELTTESPSNPFSNAPVYFIQKDSSGNMDTILMQEYLDGQKDIK